MIDTCLNADYSQLAIVHGAQLSWIASPAQGVERRLLYRVGEEQARATSLVRYSANSHFSSHLHPAGEEILVLEGVFQDEHGSYPTGSYLRNPPGSIHAPGSVDGCVIFVRLRQFHPDDKVTVAYRFPEERSTVLFESFHEKVEVESLLPLEHWEHANPRGLELLVIQGDAHINHHDMQTLSWMRLPPGTKMNINAGQDGLRFWVKDASPTLGLELAAFSL
jgi:hypothetical protein